MADETPRPPATMPSDEEIRTAVGTLARAGSASRTHQLILGVGLDPKQADALVIMYGPRDRRHLPELVALLHKFDRETR